MDVAVTSAVPYISNAAGHQVNEYSDRLLVNTRVNQDGRRRSNIRLALVLGLVALAFLGTYLYYWTS
jgi:hypothetical protein